MTGPSLYMLPYLLRYRPNGHGRSKFANIGFNKGCNHGSRRPVFWFILAATFLASDYIHFYTAIFYLLLQLFWYFDIDIHSITLPLFLYGNAGGEPRESAPPGLARTPTPREPRMEPPFVLRGPFGPCTSSSQIPPCLSMQPRHFCPVYHPDHLQRSANRSTSRPSPPVSVFHCSRHASRTVFTFAAMAMAAGLFSHATRPAIYINLPAAYLGTRSRQGFFFALTI